MRAEVAVLSRNVRIEGDPTSPQYQFGATILVNTPSTLPRAGILFEQVCVTGSKFDGLGGVATATWDVDLEQMQPFSIAPTPRLSPASTLNILSLRRLSSAAWARPSSSAATPSTGTCRLALFNLFPCNLSSTSLKLPFLFSDGA